MFLQQAVWVVISMGGCVFLPKGLQQEWNSSWRNWPCWGLSCSPRLRVASGIAFSRNLESFFFWAPSPTLMISRSQSQLKASWSSLTPVWSISILFPSICSCETLFALVKGKCKDRSSIIITALYICSYREWSCAVLKGHLWLSGSASVAGLSSGRP